MYGPTVSIYRPKVDADPTPAADLATHHNGTRSGLALWGSRRTFGSPLRVLYTPSQSTVSSPNERLSVTMSSSNRSRSLSPTPRELNALSYYDLINDVLDESDAQKEYLANEFENERRSLTRKETAANLRNAAMRLHHSEGNRLLAAEYFTKALENDPADIECLNACGVLLDDTSVLAKREKFSAGLQKLLFEQQTQESDQMLSPSNVACQEAYDIFNMALRSDAGKFFEPSIYSCMRKSISKLTPTAIRGFKSLENYKNSILWDRPKNMRKVLGSWGVRTLTL